MLEDVSSDTYHGKCMQSPATIATITGLGEAKLRLVLRTLQSIIEVLMAPVLMMVSCVARKQVQVGIKE